MSELYADIDFEIANLLRPVENEVGLEVVYENDRKRLDLAGLDFVARRLWWCSQYVLAVASYAQYVLNPDPSIGTPDAAMAELIAALSNGEPTRINSALDGIVYNRLRSQTRFPPPLPFAPLYPYPFDGEPAELSFEFVAGIHENPTRMAFYITGALIPVTLTVIIIGMSGLYRQYGESECIKKARETTDRRIDIFYKMHHLEGSMSTKLEKSFNAIIEAGDAAERRCRSALDGFEYKITVPPGFTFEAALGASSHGPKR